MFSEEISFGMNGGWVFVLPNKLGMMECQL